MAAMTAKSLIADAKTRMHTSLETVRRELSAMRTGRASLSMLDGIRVDYYGTPTPLNQVGTLSTPDPTLITVQPWDPKVLPLVEKAIRTSDLDLNPQNDGKVIRIPVPSLTEERRREIVKKAHDLAEHARNGVRQARREGNDKLKKKEKDKEISQDDERRGLDDVQKLHDRYIAEIATALQKKEQQILEV